MYQICRIYRDILIISKNNGGPKMIEEKKNMLSAALLWAWGENMKAESSDVSSDMLVAYKDGLKITFITEFDKSKEELIECIAKIKSDFIYILTNDNGKRRELIEIIPDYCGILFYGNPFGLGNLYMVLKEPQQI